MPRKKRCISENPDSDEDFDGQQHPQRNAANARERARMRVLSKAFCRLKTSLPWVPADTKLSKLDTLRLATSYIAHLRAVLTDEPLSEYENGLKHPLALTWPFSFQKSESSGPQSHRMETASNGWSSSDNTHCAEELHESSSVYSSSYFY